MRLIPVLLLICLLQPITARAEEIRASFAMDEDPQFLVETRVKFFSPAYRPLWLEALARSEADLQRQAAETIAQAHEFGFPGMAEARPRLLEILTAEKSHPTARFAAARALIALDARDSVQTLFETSQKYGADLRQLLEPKLGVWKYPPLGEVWRSRLSSQNVRLRELMLAIEGVTQMEDGDAVPSLLKIVHDAYGSPAVRLAAARAAGNLRESGLESDADQLIGVADVPILNRLCAGLLFARHSSAASNATLQKLAQDREPSVVAMALTRLLKIDPELVVLLADVAMQNPDPKVRQLGSEAYIARPNPDRVVSLVRLLDDVHPQVRGAVRDALFVLSKRPEFDSVLRPACMKVLAGESWRGQEQATLLLARLDHKAAAPRLVQLLESPRDEVLMTAAWGLQKLAVPETLPAILDKAQRQTAIREATPVQPISLDYQVVYLFETMGLMKYAPAEPLLRKHVPKNFGYGEYSRGAAIWALGYLYLDHPDEGLAKSLAERMADTQSIPPETVHVQIMSAVAIGRMQAKSQTPAVKTLLGAGQGFSHVNQALRWTYIRLTGESLPAILPTRYSKSAWFLVPLDEQPVDATP
ncbi:MAG: phycocyanobilin lyase [Planctomycetaceae bacterium]|nr:phycocyanobilin lyase [Planctomycetaceae bacterium]